MFRFTPNTIPQNIFVIGGGGTGSRLMPMLVQFIRSITRGQTALGWLENPTIWVVDDDVVETKNLLRQNFIQNDVGKPKAQVLAERYGRAYGVDVIPLVMRVDNNNSLHNAVNETLQAKGQLNHSNREGGRNSVTVMKNAIVISCVDSSAARRAILNTFVVESQGAGVGPLFIDAGNEDSFGQVNFFNAAILYHREMYDGLSESHKLPKFIGSTVDIDALPMDVQYYRDLVDTESTASCADLNQTLAINAMMATTIMGVVQNYYYRKPFTYNCVRLSLDGGNATEYLTFNAVRRLAMKSDEFSPFQYGEVKVKEKDGSTTPLRFTRYCYQQSLVYNYYTLLKDKIAADEAEIARQRREEERKRAQEAKAAEDKAKQEALAKKLKEDTKVKAVSKTKVVIENGSLPQEAAPITVNVTSSSANVSLETSPSVAEMTTGSEIPPLQPTPRRRRPARAAEAAVAAPDAWGSEGSQGWGTNTNA